MKIISTKKKLTKLIKNEKNLGFVPTMGAFHIGHISLFKKSISECRKTIVSIFVNKPQFNNKNDYKKYPRNIKKDIKKIKKLSIDYVYLPTSNQIYPKGINRKLDISLFKKKLCGKFRPGHFESVADVVERFIKIIRPDKIYFGKKDFQQFIIIKDFIKKNYPKIKIVGCKIIRDKNGLVCSSRNFFLKPYEKKNSSRIYKLILKNKKKLINKKISISFVKRKIFEYGAKKIDYIEILDINKLIKPFKRKKVFKIFIAYYMGNTRLIDNI